MELYDWPVSEYLLINHFLAPTTSALSGLFILHYNPLQYLIIYFSINWNGIALNPFCNPFISLEFFYYSYPNFPPVVCWEWLGLFFLLLYFGQDWGYG